MSLERLNSNGNFTKVSFNGGFVYYSYETPVAIETKDGTFTTDKKYSATTTKYLNKFGLSQYKVSREIFKQKLIENKIIEG